MSITPISKMIDQKRNTIMGYDRYQVEDAVRTLQRAKEIQQDPSFMRAVKVEAKRQVEALKSVSNSAERFQ